MPSSADFPSYGSCRPLASFVRFGTNGPFEQGAAVGHEYGVRLGLIGFGTAMVQAAWMQTGLTAGLQEGLAALAAFYGLGFICGELVRRVVEEDVSRRKPDSAPTPGSAGAPGVS